MNTSQDSQGATGTQFPSQVSCDPNFDQHNIVPEAPLVDSSQIPDSIKKDKLQNVDIVKNLIERCMKLYMNKDEVLKFLSDNLQIDPTVTTLVWQKLEDENPDFFQVYYTRLSLKRQILFFNELLEKQYNLMNHLSPKNFSLGPGQNGSHQMPVNNLSMGYAPLQQPLIPSTVQHQIDYPGNMSGFHGLNRVPDLSNAHQMQLYGNDLMMNRMLPLNSSSEVKSEMALKSAITGQFPFASTDIPDLGIDNSALHSTLRCGMIGPEGLPLEPNGGTGIDDGYLESFSNGPWDSSFINPNQELPILEGVGFYPDAVADPETQSEGRFDIQGARI